MGKVIKLPQNNTKNGKIGDKYGGGDEILLPTHVLSFRRKRKVEERRRRKKKRSRFRPIRPSDFRSELGFGITMVSSYPFH